MIIVFGRPRTKQPGPEAEKNSFVILFLVVVKSIARDNTHASAPFKSKRVKRKPFDFRSNYLGRTKSPTGSRIGRLHILYNERHSLLFSVS